MIKANNPIPPHTEFEMDGSPRWAFRLGRRYTTTNVMHWTNTAGANTTAQLPPNGNGCSSGAHTANPTAPATTAKLDAA